MSSPNHIAFLNSLTVLQARIDAVKHHLSQNHDGAFFAALLKHTEAQQEEFQLAWSTWLIQEKVDDTLNKDALAAQLAYDQVWSQLQIKVGTKATSSNK